MYSFPFGTTIGLTLKNEKKCYEKHGMLELNPIPTRLGHVTLISGLIPPLACRNRVKTLNGVTC